MINRQAIKAQAKELLNANPMLAMFSAALPLILSFLSLWIFYVPMMQMMMVNTTSNEVQTSIPFPVIPWTGLMISSIIIGIVQLISYLILFDYHEFKHVNTLSLSLSRYMDYLKSPQMFGFIKVYLWQQLFLSLWALIPFVGIFIALIKSYSYSQALFIYRDNTNMIPKDTIAQSRHLMNGHKWELFVLHLSFIGWHILSAITFGIVGFYVTPYQMLSEIGFYKSLTSNNLNS
jgi:hypothetical protein